jgi:nicotinate-nucleotide adenylyltransferase
VPSTSAQRPTQRPTQRIGVFGGTFDPPHVGHFVSALNVRHDLALDRVILMVANVPWQKEGSRPISPASDRLAMVRAGVAGVDGLEASDLELRRSGPTYTADTLAELADLHPGAELFTILGHDAAAGLTTWERVDEVVQRSRLVVVDRPGPQTPLPAGVDWIRVEVPHLDVSSTDLRQRVVDGRPLEFLVPEPVLAVIRSRGLYPPAPVLAHAAAGSEPR